MLSDEEVMERIRMHSGEVKNEVDKGKESAIRAGAAICWFRLQQAPENSGLVERIKQMILKDGIDVTGFWL